MHIGPTRKESTSLAWFGGTNHIEADAHEQRRAIFKPCDRRAQKNEHARSSDLRGTCDWSTRPRAPAKSATDAATTAAIATIARRLQRVGGPTTWLPQLSTSTEQRDMNGRRA